MELGLLDGELVAVTVVEDSPDGPEFFHIAIVAVALSRHGEGCGVASIDHAIDVALSMADPEAERAIISANIHDENRASQACFASAGFTPDTNVGEYRAWLLSVEFTDE